MEISNPFGGLNRLHELQKSDKNTNNNVKWIDVRVKKRKENPHKDFFSLFLFKIMFFFVFFKFKMYFIEKKN